MCKNRGMTFVDNGIPAVSREQGTHRSESHAVEAPLLLNEDGSYSKEMVYGYLDWLRRRFDSLETGILSARGERGEKMPKWHRNNSEVKANERRNPVVDQVVVEKLANGRGSIIWGIGLVEACDQWHRKQSKFPTAPIMHGIRVGNEEAEVWQELADKGNAAELLRFRLYEQVYRPENGIKKPRQKKLVTKIHGWGGTLLARMHHAKEMWEGIENSGEDPEDFVMQLISPMGGLGTGGNIPDGGVPEMQDGVDQCIGAIQGTAMMLWEEWGAGEDHWSTEGDKIGAEDAIWQVLGAVDGHSMGAWIAARMLLQLQPILQRVGNDEVKWILENPVIYGALTDDNISKDAKNYLDLENIDPKHVLLLKQFMTGWMVQVAPRLMRNKIIRDKAGGELVAGQLVNYYLGNAGIDNGEWLKINHSWTSSHDPEFIRICNAMLMGAGLIVKNGKHLQLMQRMAAEGKLFTAVGKGDKILTAREQFDFAKLLSQLYLETLDHYMEAQQARKTGALIVQPVRGRHETRLEMKKRLAVAGNMKQVPVIGR